MRPKSASNAVATVTPVPDARLDEIQQGLSHLTDPVDFLARLFAYAPIGLQIYKPDGRCLLTNRAFRDLFGSEPPPEYNVLEDEVAKARGVLDIIHRAFAGETVSVPPIWYDASELTQVRVTGRRVGVSATFFPVFDASGAVSHVGVAFKDVTAELLATASAEAQIEEKTRLEADLRRIEAQFRGLVENLPELAWSSSADGAIDFYNQRWFEYTGTTLEEMQGWGWEKVHDPEFLPTVLERWKHSLATGEPFEMEFPLRGADGVYRWFLTRVRPLRDPQGRIVRWFGMNTNVDEQRKHAVVLREAIAARDTFLSVASHELKTPLTPLNLRLQSLEKAAARMPKDDPFVERVNQYVATSRRMLGRLTVLIDDLLDVTRADGRRFQIEIDAVDYAEVVRDVASRFEEQAERLGSPLTVHAPAALPGRSDRIRLEQVTINLIDNALKYGGGKPILVGLRADGEGVQLTVTDHGIGIDPVDQKRIFEKFERAVSTRNYGGLGLGLFITRSVVEGLGGTISVESAPGQGATFTVRLAR